MNELARRTTTAELAPQISTRKGLQFQIRELGELATATDAKLGEIANRGFWMRLFSNNTRDLALAMRDIVQLNQYTIALVMAGLEIHAGNLAMLYTLCDELDSLNASLGRNAIVSTGQAEGLVQLRATIGNLSAVVSRHADALRDARATSAEAGRARGTSKIAVSIALLALALVIYMFFFR